MRRRIAFINYFCPHYRLRLFEEVARRMEADFYFFADERERYWNKRIPLVRGGAFRRMDLRLVRIAGQSFMPGVALTLNRRRYDAVVKCLNGKIMLPFVYVLCRLRGLPIVLWTGMWYHPRTRVHRLTRPLTETLYRKADAIVVYGEHVKDFLLETQGVSAEKIFVAGQAVESERFTSVTPAENGHAEILFIGQFEERKGVLGLLEAFRAVPEESARLVLVGNGGQEEQIRAAAARDPRVEIVGYVPQDELPAALARARALVLPSVTTELDREPWGLVVNEAMHAGVPVVASAGVGAAAGGLVRDGANGWIVPERDPAALAAALRSVVEDADRARAFGEQARRDAAAFTYPRMAEAFEQAVEYAIARHAGA